MNAVKKDRIMPFGKYKGYEVGEICIANPSYASWLHNFTDFKLNKDELAELNEAINEMDMTDADYDSYFGVAGHPDNFG
jgi:hypothetical protein